MIILGCSTNLLFHAIYTDFKPNHVVACWSIRL